MDSFQETWSYNEKSYKSIFSNINELRKAKCLCDVVLRVETQHFYAHRIILAACSEYFCAMFTNKVAHFLQTPFLNPINLILFPFPDARTRPRSN